MRRTARLASPTKITKSLRVAFEAASRVAVDLFATAHGLAWQATTSHMTTGTSYIGSALAISGSSRSGSSPSDEEPRSAQDRDDASWHRLRQGAPRPGNVGGQALIEGVMMRCPAAWAAAVRLADGGVVTRYDPASSLAIRYRAARLPLVRGAVALVESMAVGIRALSWSADLYAGSEVRAIDATYGPYDDRDADSSGMADGSDTERGRSDRDRQEGSASGVLAVIGGVALAFSLFVALPALLSRGVFSKVVTNALLLHALEGVTRVAVLVGYVAAVSALPDIKRVYQYHGAEHKTIACFEEGAPLEPARLSAFSTRHPRCGTSFLLTVVIVSVAVFSVIKGSLALPLQIAARLALLPVVAGVSFELIRLAWVLRHNWVGRALAAPGLALQAITTKEPDNFQLEVAIRALEKLLNPSEGAREPA